MLFAKHLHSRQANSVCPKAPAIGCGGLRCFPTHGISWQVGEHWKVTGVWGVGCVLRVEAGTCEWWQRRRACELAKAQSAVTGGGYPPRPARSALDNCSEEVQATDTCVLAELEQKQAEPINSVCADAPIRGATHHTAGASAPAPSRPAPEKYSEEVL